MANFNKLSRANPWLGLAPYTEGTSLYGRDNETSVLTDVVKNNIATIVFGKSGVGKSSLISAGISPVLNKAGYVPVKIRLVHNSDISYIEQIENAVREKIVCMDNLPDSIDDYGLWDFFHRHTFTTNEGLDCIPVIILDQFEEIFTLTDEEHKSCIRQFFQDLSSLLNNIKPDNIKELEKQHSITQISVSSGTKKLVIKRVGSSSLQYSERVVFRFVICLREDKLYLLERHSANIPSLKTNRYNLQALSPESALEVIMYPCPELFSNDEAFAIVDKLADLGDEGFRTIDPAILSLFLFKYFEKQGQANYDNIFAEYYQEATENIKGKSIAFLEDHLLTLGGYRNQLPLDDALSSGVTQEDLQSLLESIIIRKEQRKGVDYIEFSHDRLCAEAMKNRNERINKEQAKIIRRRMMLSLLIFAISAAMLSVVLWLTIRLESSEKDRKTAEALNEIINNQKDSINNQKDSLYNMNIVIQAQRDSINHSLMIQKVQNRQLFSQLAIIKEQEHRIKELTSNTPEKIVVENNVAGKISDRIPYNAITNVTNLTISGELNGTDIKYLRDNAKNLSFLDFSNARIVKGGLVYYNDKYNGTGVTKNNIIGKYMFSSMEKLETVLLPDGSTAIEGYAFNDCKVLRSINIPSSVTCIGESAFNCCRSLKSVILPDGLTTIGNGAFYSCDGLTSINIPNSVTSIGKNAFGHCCSITSISIPENVRTIGYDAFAYCEFLSFVNNSSCYSKDNWGAIIYDYDSIINGLAVKNNRVVRYKGKAKDVKIPEGITTIDPNAFSDCTWLTSISMPKSVASIGKNAFGGCCGLISIVIPDGVKSIEPKTFYSCSNLTSVTVPNSVISIGYSAFKNCSSLMSITIPESVTSIGTNCFEHCSKLTSISIPESVTSLGNSCFSYCLSLTSITIPESVTSLGSNCLFLCPKLMSITIPNSVTSLGEGCFCGCRNLIHIKSEIINIDSVDFATDEQKEYTQFLGIPLNCTWHVPVGTSKRYESQPWWIPSWLIVEEPSYTNKDDAF